MAAALLLVEDHNARMPGEPELGFHPFDRILECRDQHFFRFGRAQGKGIEKLAAPRSAAHGVGLAQSAHDRAATSCPAIPAVPHITYEPIVCRPWQNGWP
jgi:hypothetical protein